MKRCDYCGDVFGDMQPPLKLKIYSPGEGLEAGSKEFCSLSCLFFWAEDKMRV